ncbi:MAG: ATP-binding protein [Kofleriaceae bacterium]
MTASTADVILDAVPTWIALVDREHHIQFANATFRRHAGDVCGRRLEDVLGDAYLEVEPHLMRALAGTPATIELAVAGVHLRVELVPAEGGVVWHGHDITRSRAMEQQLAILAEASRRLAAPIDWMSTQHAIAHVAIPMLADWAVMFLETGDAILPTEIAPNDEATQAIARSFLPDDSWDHPVPRTMRTGRAVASDSAVLVPLVARGRALGVLMVGRARAYEPDDIAVLEELGRRAGSALATAQLFEAAHDTNQQLSAAVVRQRETDRRKDEFLAILGHELRNPLAPIVTALDLMQLSGKPGFEREREVIRRQAQHLTRLVEDLLDVSRITREKLQLRTEPLELAVVVNHAIEVASPLLEGRGHRLVVDVPRTGLVVEADLMRLGQVFANLLTNAAKYTEPGGEIVIAAIRDGEQIAICIEDNGQGISKHLLPDIFEPFVQSDRTIDRAQGGLGLGLALVRSIAQLHGGTVSAHSEGPGRGSRFVVRLPGHAHTATVRAENETTAPLGQVIASARVLVVDDNADAAGTLADILREVGYEVAIAYDAPGALQLAATFRPAIALLDIELPVMDGYELARHLRDRLADPPRLVAVSGCGHEVDLARSRAAGFDVHLGKPVRIDTLVHVLGHLEH